jgi:hypothetical protein
MLQTGSDDFRRFLGAEHTLGVPEGLICRMSVSAINGLNKNNRSTPSAHRLSRTLREEKRINTYDDLSIYPVCGLGKQEH